MHTIDETMLSGLIEQSQDLHSDAMRATADPLDELTEHIKERRSLARALAIGGIAAGSVGVLAGMASPALAAQDEDIMRLQTAASLENLAVATYGTALTLPYIKNGNAVVKAFAEKTMAQHKEHGQAFNAKLKELGAKEQTQPNPKYAPIVTAAVPKLKAGGPADVVGLAITLEDVATSTYVANIQAVTDKQIRMLFGTIAGVESQHLATLHAVAALLAGGLAAEIKLPPNAAKLPAGTAMAAIPETFKSTKLASPAAEGAVK
jgi:rubrerythrin